MDYGKYKYDKSKKHAKGQGITPRPRRFACAPRPEIMTSSSR